MMLSFLSVLSCSVIAFVLNVVLTEIKQKFGMVTKQKK